MGSGNVYYGGIGIAEYDHAALVVIAGENRCWKARRLGKDGCRPRSIHTDVVIGMEETGRCRLAVHALLVRQGYASRHGPIRSEAFRKMYICQTKTHRKDAFVIARIMRISAYSSTQLSDENSIVRRQYPRCRLAPMDSCGACKRRVTTLLDQAFPEYDRLFSFTFGITFKALLKYPARKV